MTKPFETVICPNCGHKEEHTKHVLERFYGSDGMPCDECVEYNTIEAWRAGPERGDPTPDGLVNLKCPTCTGVQDYPESWLDTDDSTEDFDCMICFCSHTQVEWSNQLATEKEGAEPSRSEYYDKLSAELEEDIARRDVREVCSDAINPSHYKQFPEQSIEMIKKLLTPDQFIGYCLGTSLKYRFRAGYKDADKIEEDIKKAVWYDTERRAQG